MAIIRNTLDKTPMPYINTKNWRFIISNPSPYNQILIILSDFNVFVVSDISLKEILTYPDNLFIKRTIKYISRSSACNKCKGTGKRDWIEKITGKSFFANLHTINIKEYIKDHRYISRIYIPKYSEKRWEYAGTIEDSVCGNFPIYRDSRKYSSFPLCKDEEEVCPECNGTGLLFLVDSLILETKDTSDFIKNLK